MTNKIFILTILLCGLVFPTTAVSQLSETAPWPMFHHDLRHTGKTNNFGTQVGKLKWKFVTMGPVTSSPAIDENGTVYIGSADNYFYAIDANTGALKWRYKTGSAIELSSPAIDINGVVYIGSNDGHLYAFDTKNIDPNNVEPWWKFKTNGAISSSPAINKDGSIVFSSADGYIYAISDSGTQKWRTKIGSSWCSPAIDILPTSDINGDQINDDPTVYIGSWIQQLSVIDISTDDNSTIVGSSNFFAIDSSNGDILWDFPPYWCSPGGIFASPVIASDQRIIVSFFSTYISTCDDEESNFVLWSLNPEGSWNWAIELGEVDIYTTPAMLEDNSFFFGSGSILYRVVPDSQEYLAVEIPTDTDRIESSPAIDNGKLVFIGSNAGRFYCLCADCPETPIRWQYPPEDQPALVTEDGNTIASIISSPAIGNDDRNSVYVGASDGSVYAFYDGPQISGSVNLVDDNNNKTPLSSVKMILTSTLTTEIRVTYTDTNGNYTFYGVENYEYTVTPEKIGYYFSPPKKKAVVKNDQDPNSVNFEAFDGFTVHGNIESAGDLPFSNVEVTIEGETSLIKRTVSTDNNGAYEFDGLGYDTYTITPNSDGYGFDPPFYIQTIDTEDDQRSYQIPTFTGTDGYQISGKIIDITKDGTDNGIEGIEIGLTGGKSDKTETNANGAYSFSIKTDEAGTYTITPRSNQHNFVPESQEITVSSGNVANVDFNAATGTTIYGYVQSDNATIPIVTVNLYNYNNYMLVQNNNIVEAERNVTTDETGKFTFVGVASGRYIVKPSLEDYGFEPAVQIVTVIGEETPEPVSFVAKQGLYISGRVTNILSMGIADVTLTIDPSCENATTVTQSGGTYSFAGLTNDTYIISIDPETYSAIPPTQLSQTVPLLFENKENINFRVTPSISMVYLNIPFWGTEGTIVNIFGNNFGWIEPSDSSAIAGVYFGTQDTATWTKADVLSWTNNKIVAEAPDGFGLVQVWVINEDGEVPTTLQPTNFFLLGLSF